VAALSATVARTLELYRTGKRPEEIADLRGLSTVTVQGHLADALLLGEEIDLDRLIAPARREAILAAMDGDGGGPLRPVLDRLGDGYSYGELRLVQAALNAGRPPSGADAAAATPVTERGS
jgi:ATP-dependent DNA helicase RecQ